MKTKFLITLLCLAFIFGCEERKENKKPIEIEKWLKRKIDISKKDSDSLLFGKSYLSIYSQIYSLTELKTHNLTVMVSLRNTSDTDTIYLLKAEYFDTHGKLVQTYFDKPIFLTPMETTEIIIDETDISGGTGSNMIFEWKKPKNSSDPLFEAIMNSTKGQQGLSFITQSVRIK